MPCQHPVRLVAVTRDLDDRSSFHHQVRHLKPRGDRHRLADGQSAAGTSCLPNVTRGTLGSGKRITRSLEHAQHRLASDASINCAFARPNRRQRFDRGLQRIRHTKHKA